MSFIKKKSMASVESYRSIEILATTLKERGIKKIFHSENLSVLSDNVND
jgi:hypothetical protein